MENVQLMANFGSNQFVYQRIVDTIYFNKTTKTQSSPSGGDAWVNYVAEQKLMNLGGEKTKLANTIINSPPNFVQKYVSVVDKSTGEINFLKLANY